VAEIMVVTSGASRGVGLCGITQARLGREGAKARRLALMSCAGKGEYRKQNHAGHKRVLGDSRHRCLLVITEGVARKTARSGLMP
jgi:hypothetical protein